MIFQGQRIKRETKFGSHVFSPKLKVPHIKRFHLRKKTSHPTAQYIISHIAIQLKQNFNGNNLIINKGKRTHQTFPCTVFTETWKLLSRLKAMLWKRSRTFWMGPKPVKIRRLRAITGTDKLTHFAN